MLVQALKQSLDLLHINRELLWLKQMLEDLKIQYKYPLQLFCDNKLVINIAHNHIHNHIQCDTIKDIEID